MMIYVLYIYRYEYINIHPVGISEAYPLPVLRLWTWTRPCDWSHPSSCVRPWCAPPGA